MEATGFITAAAASAMIAKLIMEGIKLGVDLGRGTAVLIAFVAAELSELALLYSQRAVMDGPSLVGAGIIGLFAWGITIGVGSLQNRADKVDARIDAAIAAPPGTTKSDIDKQVFSGTGSGA